MPADRLSELLHDLDDLPVAPGPASAVRARGTSIRRRRQGAAGAGLLAAAAAAAVVVGGLSGGTQTSLQPAPFASTPAGEPGALPGEDGPDVVDGGDLGFVRELTDDEVVLDRAVWLDQEQLEERYAAEGRDPAEAVAYEIVDERDDLRRYPVSPDVAVTVSVGLAPPDLQGGSVSVTLDELQALLVDPVVAEAHLFDVTLQDGVVVAVDHRYAA